MELLWVCKYMCNVGMPVVFVSIIPTTLVWILFGTATATTTFCNMFFLHLLLWYFLTCSELMLIVSPMYTFLQVHGTSGPWHHTAQICPWSYYEWLCLYMWMPVAFVSIIPLFGYLLALPSLLPSAIFCNCSLYLLLWYFFVVFYS